MAALFLFLCVLKSAPEATPQTARRRKMRKNKMQQQQQKRAINEQKRSKNIAKRGACGLKNAMEEKLMIYDLNSVCVV